MWNHGHHWSVSLTSPIGVFKVLDKHCVMVKKKLRNDSLYFPMVLMCTYTQVLSPIFITI